jgi:hypothetical protein
MEISKLKPLEFEYTAERHGVEGNYYTCVYVRIDGWAEGFAILPYEARLWRLLSAICEAEHHAAQRLVYRSGLVDYLKTGNAAKDGYKTYGNY